MCRTHPEFVCQLLKSGPPATETIAALTDPRLKAAVIAAPGLGAGFTPQSLNTVTVPMQIWFGDQDGNAPPATNALAIAAQLKTLSEAHKIKGAGHFSFLTPCGTLRVILPPMLCTDPKGFDRDAFHKEFNAEVVAFYKAHF